MHLYFYFSFAWLLVRTAVVSMSAANVYEQSMSPIEVLYCVPSKSFCVEVGNPPAEGCPLPEGCLSHPNGGASCCRAGAALPRAGDDGHRGADGVPFLLGNAVAHFDGECNVTPCFELCALHPKKVHNLFLFLQLVGTVATYEIVLVQFHTDKSKTALAATACSL